MGRASRQPHAVSVSEHSDRFTNLFGTRRGTASPARALSDDATALAQARVAAIVELIDSTSSDRTRLERTAGALKHAIVLLSGGHDPRSELEPIAVVRGDHTGDLGRHSVSAEELIENYGYLGLWGALQLCTDEMVNIGDVDSGARVELHSKEHILVALQLAWLIFTYWEWLQEIGGGAF